MFPELIAGIKLMKSMNIRVNPARDRVDVDEKDSISIKSERRKYFYKNSFLQKSTHR